MSVAVDDELKRIRANLWADVVANTCDDKCGGLRSAIHSADSAIAEFDKRFLEEKGTQC